MIVSSSDQVTLPVWMALLAVTRRAAAVALVSIGTLKVTEIA